jgi:APA family basic amino acid/polyamine antiporter
VLPDLSRRLGRFDSIMMMVGIVIGSGIFLTTGIMARSIPSPTLILLAWLVGGAITLTGAVTFAELGAAMPQAGGQYVYLREAYGPLAGFLFGWILFLISMGGSIAALAVGFAEYLGYFLPSLSGKVVAVGVIVLLSAFNYIGVGLGKSIQNIFTVAKIGAMAAFIILGLTVGRVIEIDWTLNPQGVASASLWVGFGVAIIAVQWAFDGWHNVTYIAGEIKDPRRNLPVALIAGTLIITALYLLINYVYLLALPMNEMAGVVRIAERSSTALFGGATAGLISAAVLISIFGALNGAIFAALRVYYAMARDRVFFQKVGQVHPRFGTPAFAILLQCLWAGALALTGTYEQLFTYVVFVTLTFWIAAVAAVFVLRRRRPDMPRPYRTPGYPVVPAVFIAATAAILINTLFARPVESLAGLGLTLLGIPVYYYWRNRSGVGGNEHAEA